MLVWPQHGHTGTIERNRIALLNIAVIQATPGDQKTQALLITPRRLFAFGLAAIDRRLWKH